MGEVVDLNCITTVDLSPDSVLEAAKGQYDYVLVVGFKPDGEFAMASSESDMAKVAYVASKVLHELHTDKYITTYR